MQGDSPLSRSVVIFLVCLTLLLIASSSDSFLLPDTGQTTCYTVKGKIKPIPCPLAGNSAAQDGSYIINPPSYTLNSAGIVRDNYTFLMWQRRSDGTLRTWQQANEYCQALNIDGYTDWRLPSRKEYMSLLLYESHYYDDLAIDTDFFDDLTYYFWTSNYGVDTNYYSSEWGIFLGDGISNIRDKYNMTMHSRCVRGQQLLFGNFIENGNGTVSDDSTGLEWQKNYVAKDWNSALSYCENLSLGGHMDWRLPNIKELESISDVSKAIPSIDTIYFPATASNNYWSSTNLTISPNFAFVLNFYDGEVAYDAKSAINSCRCVRGKRVQRDEWEMQLTPNTLDYGITFPGSSSVQSFTISNSSSGILQITAVQMPEPPFTIISENCTGQSLLGTTACSVTVSFTPPEKGVFTSKINIVSNDSDHPFAKVGLTGRTDFFFPDTGQQDCYDLDGINIECPLPDDPLAQDGSYLINPPSFMLNGDGTVIDNNTGLMWQQDDNYQAFNWYESSGTYDQTYNRSNTNVCSNLQLGGYANWRLPALKELATLIYYGPAGPKIDTTIFHRTFDLPTLLYWSSEKGATVPNSAVVVNFESGNVATIGADNDVRVRCVRGESLPTSFVINGDGTVNDFGTDLMWQQYANSSEADSSFSYCEGSLLAGYSDWRLPNILELMSMTDYSRTNPALDTTVFPQELSYYDKIFFWSSTHAWGGSRYFINESGAVDYQIPFNTVLGCDMGIYQCAGFARCVRNITPLLDSREIQVDPSTLNFGTIDAGNALTLSLSVSNLGSDDLTIGSITSPSVPFSITSDNCSGQTLLSTVSCSVSVTFSPAVSGTYSNMISIPSNDGDNPEVIVNLSGIAEPTKAALTGHVTDFSLGLPLPGTAVEVADSVHTSTTTTTADGSYNVSGLLDGIFTANFEKIGYIPQTVAGTLVAGQTHTLDIQLTPAPPLAIAITSPQSGAILNSSPITVSGNVSNNAQVSVNGTPATVANGIFSASIGLSDGQNNITASANDQYGQTASDSIIVTVTLPPTISDIAASDITLDSATITWLTDQPASTLFEYGTTPSYGFTYADPLLTSGYTISLTGLLPSTTYHYRITSTNSNGLSSSADRTFTTLSPPPAITVTVTSPADGATINNAHVIVTGTISNTTGNETGVVVNGKVATVYGNQFVANNISMEEGANTINITATDTEGNTRTVSSNINAVTTGNHIRLISNIDSGISPLEAYLRLDGSFSINESNLSITGPGQAEIVSSSADEYELRFTVEGIYYIIASATDPDGLTYQDTIAIVVLDKAEFDALLQAKWEGMKGALMSQDIQGAVSYHMKETRDLHNELFTALLDQLQDIAQDMQSITLIYLQNNTAKYRGWKNELYGGQMIAMTYYIYFIIDRDGVWRIYRY